MKEELIAAFIEGIIEVGIGIYLLLMRNRIVGEKPGENPKYDKMIEDNKNLFLIVALILFAFAVFRIISRIF